MNTQQTEREESFAAALATALLCIGALWLVLAVAL